MRSADSGKGPWWAMLDLNQRLPACKAAESVVPTLPQGTTGGQIAGSQENPCVREFSEDLSNEESCCDGKTGPAARACRHALDPAIGHRY